MATSGQLTKVFQLKKAETMPKWPFGGDKVIKMGCMASEKSLSVLLGRAIAMKKYMRRVF